MSDEPNFSPRTDLPVIIAAFGTAVAAVVAVRVDHNLATVATAAGAVVTSLLGYLKARRADANAQTVARIAADAVMGTNAKTVLVETVTAERAVWRRELRAAAAELATALRSSSARRPFDATRLDHLISEIRLRLNQRDGSQPLRIAATCSTFLSTRRSTRSRIAIPAPRARTRCWPTRSSAPPLIC